MKGWYRTVAGWNPMSYIVEGMRGFVNSPLAADQFTRAWLIPAAISVLSIAFALRAMHNRLAAS